MKAKSNLNDDLPPTRTKELCNLVIVVRSAFHEARNFTHKFSQMSAFMNINVSEGIDVNETTVWCK